jgi:hypothetical protein
MRNVLIIAILFVLYILITEPAIVRSANTPTPTPPNPPAPTTSEPDPEPEPEPDPDPEPEPEPNPEPPVSGFTDFELNVLPGLISGTNDVNGKNRLGFEVFPATNGQPTVTFVPRFIWGDGVEFLNHSGDTPPIALQKGLATGFDNSYLNTVAAVPSNHRYKWVLFNDFEFWQQTHQQLEERGAYEYSAVKSRSIDSNKVNVPFRFTMLDIEGGVTDNSKITAFLKGYYNAAKLDNPNHELIYYGYPPNQGFVYWHNGYSYAGDSVPLDEKFFPFSKHEWNESHAKVSAGILTEWWRGKDILYNILVSYSKVNLPLTSTMYQKSGGNFVLDSYGQRVFRNDYFQEEQRGEIIHFSAAGNLIDISSGEQHNYGWYRLKPEVFHAAHQFGGYYSELFFRLQMLANMVGLGDDFQNVHQVSNPYLTCGILRHDLESNPFTNWYRPVDRVNTEWHAAMVFTLLNNLSLWTGFTGGDIGLTKAGAYILGNWIPDMHKSSFEGEPFAQPYFGEGEGQPKTQGHLGNYRQIAAKMYQMQAENRVTGLWQRTDKVLAFAHPEQIINGHFPCVGRLQGKWLKLQAIEARLEIGESFDVTIRNTKNSTTFTKTIQSKKVLNTLIELPAGTYNAQDIIIEFNNPVKSGLHKVNGRGETVA